MTVKLGQPAPTSVHTALRLVPGDQGTWLVDQAVHLINTDVIEAKGADADRRSRAERTNTEAARAALERK